MKVEQSGLIHVVSPATPPSGITIIYAKTDGIVYSKDDTGLETALGAAGSFSAEATQDATNSPVSITSTSDNTGGDSANYTLIAEAVLAGDVYSNFTLSSLGTASGQASIETTSDTTNPSVFNLNKTTSTYAEVKGSAHPDTSYLTVRTTDSLSNNGSITLRATKTADVVTASLEVESEVQALGIVGIDNTGVRTATFTATNAPGASNVVVRKWLQVTIGGVMGYIPWFSA